MSSRYDGVSRAATTLARGHVADAAVSVLIVLPAHEFSCPRAGGVEVSEVFGGELGAVLGGAEQRLRVGVVIADVGREYGGLTPSQYGIASIVVAFSLKPLLPCSTGLIVLWRRFPRPPGFDTKRPISGPDRIQIAMESTAWLQQQGNSVVARFAI